MARDKGERSVIVGKAACDYLALTTFSQKESEFWLEVVAQMNLKNPTEAAFAQYKGVGWDEGVKLVSGPQGEQTHYMLTASGAVADIVLRWVIGQQGLGIESVNCTRFDVQITLPPVLYRPRLSEIALLYQKGELGQFTGRGKPNVSAVVGDETDTLYIGSRSSETFARVYDKKVKPLSEVAQIWERYEVEFKGSRAMDLWNKCRKMPENRIDTPIKQALKAHIENLPPAMAELIKAAQHGQVDIGGVMPKHTPRGKNSKVKWVSRMREALLKAAKLEGKDGEEVRKILMGVFMGSVSNEPTVDMNAVAIVSPEGKVYNVEGIEYNRHVDNNGVLITDIHHSTITIEKAVGGNYTNTTTATTQKAQNGQGDLGNGNS